MARDFSAATLTANLALLTKKCLGNFNYVELPGDARLSIVGPSYSPALSGGLMIHALAPEKQVLIAAPDNTVPRTLIGWTLIYRTRAHSLLAVCITSAKPFGKALVVQAAVDMLAMYDLKTPNAVDSSLLPNSG